jgi:UrcA family protein
MAAQIGAARPPRILRLGQRKLSCADLNLDNSAGASTFYRRIRAAADDGCSSNDGRDLKSTALQQQCVENAVSDSALQVNKASVTAIHNRAEGHAS